MSPPAEKRDIPNPPRVFAAPWHAQAFSFAVKLHEAGHFTWKEWTERLGAELAATPETTADTPDDHYYECWLRALEKLVAEKGLLSAGELEARRQAWIDAARRTPHGRPIVLSNEND